MDKDRYQYEFAPRVNELTEELNAAGFPHMIMVMIDQDGDLSEYHTIMHSHTDIAGSILLMLMRMVEVADSGNIMDDFIIPLATEYIMHMMLAGTQENLDPAQILKQIKNLDNLPETPED